MRAHGLLLLCLFGSALVSLTVANYGIGPDSCCFHYSERQVKFAQIRSYDVTDGSCSMPAVILRTLSHVPICVNPEAEWVKRAMTRLDDRNFEVRPDF